MTTTFLVPKNDASSTLASGISDSDASLTVASGEGAKFPSTYPFNVRIDDEILQCTNRSTDTLTVTRAQEGTTAAAHASGKAVELVITAKAISDLNTAVNTLETARSRVRAYLNANQSVPTDTWTKINLNKEDFDTLNEFDTTNHKFVASTAGYYVVNGNVGFATAVADKVIYVGIRKNNSEEAIVSYQTSCTNTIYGNVSAIIYLAVNDYLDLWVYHEFGTNYNVNGNRAVTYLSVAKLLN